uniref:Cadherin domain-containing protein n=1 Tax=Caenorhabditis japonica TaxID=281687 RepID=A0A8R1I1P6_CAEJA
MKTINHYIQRSAFERRGEVFNLPGASAKSELVTHVIDDNNYSSVFEKDRFLINIIEGQSKKVQIVVPKFAEGKNGHISYSISEKINLPVHIANGVLFVGAIDREAMADSIVNLTITASDTEKPARNSTTVVTIRVKDINDNPPIFSNSRYSIVLGAFISPGGVVGKISATDKDATSPNNYVHYFSHDPQFKISDEGEIVFMGSGILQKDDHMQFNITATDGGKPPLSATAKVVINEHRGKTNGVQNEVTTQISSNDTVEKSEIKWLNAGMSGYTYEIIKATVNGFEDQKVMEWLKIDKKTGRIETLKRIDPVKVKTIKVYISMRKGKREVPVELIINVTDADEITSSYMKSAVPRNFTTPEPGTIAAEVGAQPTEGVRPEIRVKPIFKNSSVFTTFINEDSILGTVLSLPYPLATNSDDGHIGGLLYSMTENEPYFKIDEKNSTIRLIAPLDFKTQKMHFLNIKCVDNNGELPYHESFASVVVNVINAKNNYPVISNTDLLHLNVGEDAKPETVITIFKVSDADGFEKTQLDVNSSMFKVDESFKLLVATSLKGYAGQRLCSTVTARNKQDRVATSPYCVTVYPAKNTHHNPLVISPKQNSIHYFDENIVYDELLKFTVLEEYESSKVTFRLNEMFKKDWQLFSIDKNNGSLKSKQPFDFEKKTVHEIKILTCQADNCSSTHLFISVNDRNDNCPMFPKQDVRLTVLENEKGKRQVGRIPAALDSDFHSDNTKVCYTTDTLIFFFSDPTLPILFTNSSFDREHKKQHQITINAYDCNLSCRDPHQPMNGTIVALIDVIDVNDNFPKFTKKSYASTVVQGQAMAGSHILTVQATDLDDELNGLAYSLRGFTFTLSESPISVDQSTGEVIANELLKESSYYFTVIVVDSAGHEDTASVMVSVVTYAQQTELVFDAPFELIMKNEKNISE